MKNLTRHGLIPVLTTKEQEMISVEEAKSALAGPIASVSTPFKRDGSIDYKSLDNIVEFIIEAGSGTVLLTYGDSLYSLLTDDEIAGITKRVIQQTKGRAMTVAAGSWWLGKSIEFAKYARDLGADLFMPLSPDWANSGSIKKLEEFYTTISEILPVMMVTNLGKRPIPIEIIQNLLVGENNIVAIKDDKCGEYGKKATKMVNGKWAFLSGGRMKNHLDVMPFGADGYLSVYMRFMPAIAHRYWNAVIQNDIKASVQIIRDYDTPFMEDLPAKLNLNFDALIHAAMEVYGIAERWRRNPYMNASDEQMELIKAFFAQEKFKNI
jgi:4-hydroxy-tetrahydrodipicolinate synthase